MQRRQALKHLTTLAAAATLPRTSFGLTASSQELAPSSPTPVRPGIFLNQIGYLPQATKIATLANLSLEGPQAFRIVKLPDHSEAFAGTFQAPSDQPDPASGDQITLADFSALTAPGTYRLEAAGLQSDPFRIGDDVYRHALYLTIRAFYGQRCGCKVDLGDGYKHPICHTDGAYQESSGRSGRAKHLGGWHDAGDYGRYVVNSGISTSTLLYAYELYPDTLHTFTLDIPRPRRHLPDILSEIRWNLDWMISLQDRDGGVWHKQTSEHFCAFIMPQDDKLTSYIIGSGHAPYKTTASTADLAGTAAIAARVYAPFDRHYANSCLQVARNAWLWAISHPAQPFENPPGVSTGGYGDSQLSDEILWASAELFRTTGEAQYEAQFLAGFSPEAARLQIPEPGWGNLFALSCFAYAEAPKASPAIKTLIVAAFQQAAEGLLKASAANGYGHTLNPHQYFWGSNGACANQSFLLSLADRLAPHPGYRSVALNNLHYLLGRNALGVSWVTHLGARPFLHPHHRPSAADGILEPWPGLLSGGPNARPGDEVARTLPLLPPMRMWLDDERAYSLNEVAINWNAPLVFLLTAANSRW